MARGSGGHDRRQQGGGNTNNPSQPSPAAGPSYILDRHLLPRVQALRLVSLLRGG